MHQLEKGEPLCWPEVLPRIESITYRISTDFGVGTGFIVQVQPNLLTIATAWHVIQELSEVPDKYARFVELVSATGKTTIRANSIGVARLGPEESDTGIVWIGTPFSSGAVDRILASLVGSGIKDGLLDVSGGGGVIEIEGDGSLVEESAIPTFLRRSDVVRGIEVGWLGYPSVANESPCFFSGRVSGFLQSPPFFLIDGSGIRGLSGGPVFDKTGRILGIVSRYLGPDTKTLVGLMAVVPIAPVEGIRSG